MVVGRHTLVPDENMDQAKAILITNGSNVIVVHPVMICGMHLLEGGSYLSTFNTYGVDKWSVKAAGEFALGRVNKFIRNYGRK
jgi:hypothetical protein